MFYACAPDSGAIAGVSHMDTSFSAAGSGRVSLDEKNVTDFEFAAKPYAGVERYNVDAETSRVSMVPTSRFHLCVYVCVYVCMYVCVWCKAWTQILRGSV